MSTFTDFNGPHGCGGPSTKDLLALIASYNELNTKLNNHIAELANKDGSTVHGIKDYVEDVIAKLNTVLAGKADCTTVGNESINKVNGVQPSDVIDAVNKLNQYLDGYFAKQDALLDYLPKTSTTGSASSTNPVQSKSDVDKAIADLKIDDYAKSDDVDSKLKDLEDKLVGSDSTVTPLDSLTAGVVKATDYLLGTLHAKKYIDFTEWVKFNAPFAGTGSMPDTKTNGVYIIGQVSDNWVDDANAPTQANASKSGTVYLKYINTHPMDAIIDFTVTYANGSYIGALNVTATKEKGAWSNLAYHLVVGTDSNGNKKVYVAVSADKLSKTSDEYSNLEFRACGINFLPVSVEGYSIPTGMLECLATVDIGTDTSGSTAFSNTSFSGMKDSNGNSVFETKTVTDSEGNVTNMLVLGSDNYDEVVFATRPKTLLEDEKGIVTESPLVAVSDLQHLAVPVGAIIRWAPVNSDGTLKNVPDGWLDISEEQKIPATDYPELAELLGKDNDGNIILPIETHSIIKAKYFDIMNVKTSQDYSDIINVKSVSKALKEEVARATDAENTLQENIDKEQELRENADSDIVNNQLHYSKSFENATSIEIDLSAITPIKNKDYSNSPMFYTPNVTVYDTEGNTVLFDSKIDSSDSEHIKLTLDFNGKVISGTYYLS